MGPWKRAGMGVGLVHIPPGVPLPLTVVVSKNFSWRSSVLLPSCFRRLRIWKQKILQKEIHESLQRDDGAPERIRTADPQIRSHVLDRDTVGRFQAITSQKN